MQIKLMGFYRDGRRNLRLLTRLDASLGRAALPLFPLFYLPVRALSDAINKRTLSFSILPTFASCVGNGQHRVTWWQTPLIQLRRQHPIGKQMKTTCWMRKIDNFISRKNSSLAINKDAHNYKYVYNFLFFFSITRDYKQKVSCGKKTFLNLDYNYFK